jgi:hypothetical protein
VKAMLEGASKLARLELKALVSLQNKSKNKSLSAKTNSKYFLFKNILKYFLKKI